MTKERDLESPPPHNTWNLASSWVTLTGLSRSLSLCCEFAGGEDFLPKLFSFPVHPSQAFSFQHWLQTGEAPSGWQVTKLFSSAVALIVDGKCNRGSGGFRLERESNLYVWDFIKSRMSRYHEISSMENRFWLLLEHPPPTWIKFLISLTAENHLDGDFLSVSKTSIYKTTRSLLTPMEKLHSLILPAPKSVP